MLNAKKYSKREISDKLNELNPFIDIGKFIGVEFEKNMTVKDFLENKDFEFEYSKRYNNIIAFSKLI